MCIVNMHKMGAARAISRLDHLLPDISVEKCYLVSEISQDFSVEYRFISETWHGLEHRLFLRHAARFENN